MVPTVLAGVTKLGKIPVQRIGAIPVALEGIATGVIIAMARDGKHAFHEIAQRIFDSRAKPRCRIVGMRTLHDSAIGLGNVQIGAARCSHGRPDVTSSVARASKPNVLGDDVFRNASSPRKIGDGGYDASRVVASRVALAGRVI